LIDNGSGENAYKTKLCESFLLNDAEKSFPVFDPAYELQVTFTPLIFFHLITTSATPAGSLRVVFKICPKWEIKAYHKMYLVEVVS
jgi:hypothetical protein